MLRSKPGYEICLNERNGWMIRLLWKLSRSFRDRSFRDRSFRDVIFTAGLLLRLFPDVGVLGMAIPFSLVYKQIIIYSFFRWSEEGKLQALAKISFDGRAGG